MKQILKNYEKIISDLHKSCEHHGRDCKDVRLIAVSKKHSSEKIKLLHTETGHRYFGENYVQELVEKATFLSLPSIHWIFIGKLQSNKIKVLVQHCHEIQSVESLKQARQIDLQAEAFGKKNFPIFLLVNIAREPQKAGLFPEQAQALAKDIEDHCRSLDLRGIMAIPPHLDPEKEKEKLLEFFFQLRDIAKTVGKGELSLGMSGDYDLAIQAGSNHVRIGTSLFGIRPV